MQSILNFIKLQDIEIIGSYTDPERKFKGDIDLQEVFKSMRPERFLSELQYKLREIKRANNVFFIDFKAGSYGKSIKWTYDEIQNGFRYLDNRRIDLLGSLYTDTVIKLDLVIFDKKGIMLPTSINYYFSGLGKKTTTNFYKRSLISEMRQLRDKGDYYSFIKRSYLYYNLEKDRMKVDELLKLLNDLIGQLGVAIGILSSIILLLKSDNVGYSMDNIHKTIIYISRGLKTDIKGLFIPLESADKERLIKRIPIVISELQNIIEREYNKIN